MKKTLITTLLIFVFINCYSQSFINRGRSASKRSLLKFWSKHKGKPVQTITTETDSTLTYLIRDSSVQNLDMLLHFNESGKCYKEVRTLNCDSCYQKHLKSVLALKVYKWKKIDDQTYISKPSKMLILTAPDDKPFTFAIQRNYMSRSRYKQQFKKA